MKSLECSQETEATLGHLYNSIALAGNKWSSSIITHHLPKGRCYPKSFWFNFRFYSTILCNSKREVSHLVLVDILLQHLGRRGCPTRSAHPRPIGKANVRERNELWISVWIASSNSCFTLKCQYICMLHITIQIANESRYSISNSCLQPPVPLAPNTNVY